MNIVFITPTPALRRIPSYRMGGKLYGQSNSITGPLIAFAKSIDAYQLQPAILTPFPGTPVYDQFVQENRMITNEWEQFDMINVTFRPKQMSPWELQEEFYAAVNYFYTFRSGLRIWRLFGAEYGLRRIGLSVVTRLGTWGARFCSTHVKRSSYYKLRHLDDTNQTLTTGKPSYH